MQVMTIRELAGYCKASGCDKCNHTEKCAKFKDYLQSSICPASLFIKGCEGIIDFDRKIYPYSPL